MTRPEPLCPRKSLSVLTEQERAEHDPVTCRFCDPSSPDYVQPWRPTPEQTYNEKYDRWAGWFGE